MAGKEANIVWPDRVDTKKIFQEWGMHSFEPEEIAHTIQSESSARVQGHTETWPVSYSFQLDTSEDESQQAQEKKVSKVAEFLKAIAPSTRKKNLSMVQSRNDWISKPDGSIEPMNLKKWISLEKAESRSIGQASEGNAYEEEMDEEGDEVGDNDEDGNQDEKEDEVDDVDEDEEEEEEEEDEDDEDDEDDDDLLEEEIDDEEEEDMDDQPNDQEVSQTKP